jgi:Tfp pilus assembly protein PilV
MSLNVKKNGFSLVEVMLALVLTGFCIIMILGIFPIAMKDADNLDVSERMYLTGQQAMDQITFSNSFINTSLTKMNPPPVQMPTDSSGKPMGEVYYWGNIPEPPVEPRFQEVFVEVRWKQRRAEGMQRVQTYRISGYIVR